MSSPDQMSSLEAMMQKFLEKQRESRLEMRHIGKRVEKVVALLTVRMDEIDWTQAESRLKIDENANEIDRLKSEIFILKEAAEHYADMCKIRFGGLPVFPDDKASTEVVASVVKVLKCDESVIRIVSVRQWMPPKPRTASGAAAADLSLVARFTSPVARDAVMLCTYRLANVICDSIFGTANQGKILVSAILPPALYKLWRAALAKSKELNCVRPLLRGSSVFMRATPTSPLLGIKNLSKLAALKPMEGRQPSSVSDMHQD
ncbi:hypothetical protein TKK_0015362 [Trichogramma kaykai]